jgi:hypothetical protein
MSVVQRKTVSRHAEHGILSIPLGHGADHSPRKTRNTRKVYGCKLLQLENERPLAFVCFVYFVVHVANRTA